MGFKLGCKKKKFEYKRWSKLQRKRDFSHTYTLLKCHGGSNVKSLVCKLRSFFHLARLRWQLGWKI